MAHALYAALPQASVWADRFPAEILVGVGELDLLRPDQRIR
jgi:hypothetical protein